jgi:HEPN domain
LRKAEQFCTAAAAALAADHYDAAMLDAVHAGISSADAVCVGLGGRRSADPDHMRAADLLETVGANSPPIKEKAQVLRSLIQLKNRVEYEDKPATRVDAETAAKRCERLVSWAKEELVRARLM